MNSNLFRTGFIFLDENIWISPDCLKHCDNTKIFNFCVFARFRQSSHVWTKQPTIASTFIIFFTLQKWRENVEESGNTNCSFISETFSERFQQIHQHTVENISICLRWSFIIWEEVSSFEKKWTAALIWVFYWRRQMFFAISSLHSELFTVESMDTASFSKHYPVVLMRHFSLFPLVEELWRRSSTLAAVLVESRWRKGDLSSTTIQHQHKHTNLSLSASCPSLLKKTLVSLALRTSTNISSWLFS